MTTRTIGHCPHVRCARPGRSSQMSRAFTKPPICPLWGSDTGASPSPGALTHPGPSFGLPRLLAAQALPACSCYVHVPRLLLHGVAEPAGALGRDELRA